jgi:hypothetical protein
VTSWRAFTRREKWQASRVELARIVFNARRVRRISRGDHAGVRVTGAELPSKGCGSPRWLPIEVYRKGPEPFGMKPRLRLGRADTTPCCVPSAERWQSFVRELPPLKFLAGGFDTLPPSGDSGKRWRFAPLASPPHRGLLHGLYAREPRTTRLSFFSRERSRQRSRPWTCCPPQSNAARTRCRGCWSRYRLQSSPTAQSETSGRRVCAC